MIITTSQVDGREKLCSFQLCVHLVNLWEWDERQATFRLAFRNDLLLQVIYFSEVSFWGVPQVEISSVPRQWDWSRETYS